MPENDGRQLVKYSFYRVDPLWRRLSPERRAESKRELAAVVDELAAATMLRSYSLVGMRGDADFMLWQASDSLEEVQQAASRLWGTELGGYLEMAHSYLAMTRRSQYVGRHRHQGQEGARLRVSPGDGRYLFVYPFVKTRDWYLLPEEERQAMMDEHIRVGHKYPSVRINTSYSFGLDDQEFVVAFDSDSPSDFLDLVMELRGIEGSRYTLRDTPIFTCIGLPIEQVLDTLGG